MNQYQIRSNKENQLLFQKPSRNRGLSIVPQDFLMLVGSTSLDSRFLKSRVLILGSSFLKNYPNNIPAIVAVIRQAKEAQVVNFQPQPTFKVPCLVRSNNVMPPN